MKKNPRNLHEEQPATHTGIQDQKDLENQARTGPGITAILRISMDNCACDTGIRFLAKQRSHSYSVLGQTTATFLFDSGKHLGIHTKK